MTDINDLTLEEIGKVSGGNAPDPSQLRQWPWEEVVEKLKDYVRWFKHRGDSYERGWQTIQHCIDNALVYPFVWGQDEVAIENTYRHLWDTWETSC